MMYSVRIPMSGIQHEESCRSFVDTRLMGNGKLYITEDEVVWANNDQQGFRLQYCDIAVHAISTDRQAFPEECLYVMYNRDLLNSDDDSSDDDTPVTEIRFVPDNTDTIKHMFNAMSDCQCLHPDEEDSDYEPGFEDGAAGEGFYTGQEGIDHLTSQGRATMERLEDMLVRNEAGSGDSLVTGVNGINLNENNEDNEEQMDPGQFEDA